MSDEFETHGAWHLPQHPDRAISGTLGYVRGNSAILNLEGTLPGLLEEDVVEIILGETNLGSITLRNCRRMSHKEIEQATGEFDQDIFFGSATRFVVDCFFIGAHFPERQDITFRTIVVHYTQFDSWMNSVSGVYLGKHEDDILIRIRKPESIEAIKGEDYEVFIDVIPSSSLEFDLLLPTSRWLKDKDNEHGERFVPLLGTRNATISQDVRLRIQFTTERPIEDYEAIILRFGEFLSLSALQPVYVLDMTGMLEVNHQPGTNDETDETLEVPQSYMNHVAIYRGLRELPGGVLTTWPVDLLFSFDDVKEFLSSMLGNWFSKARALGPVTQLYFGTLYNRYMYPQQRFLSLAQAVESYHRRTMENSELPRAEFRSRLRTILEQTPDEYHDWLKEKLKYSNEPNLRTRLIALLNRFSNVLEGIIDDRETFVGRVVVTRNYLTHYSENLKERASEGQELSQLSEFLEALVEIFLLHELGFTDESISAMLINNKKFVQRLGLDVLEAETD